jgi:hypothetical protein
MIRGSLHKYTMKLGIVMYSFRLKDFIKVQFGVPLISNSPNDKINLSNLFVDLIIIHVLILNVFLDSDCYKKLRTELDGTLSAFFFSSFPIL